MKPRRLLMVSGLAVVVSLLCPSLPVEGAEAGQHDASFVFGLIADCQYCPDPGEGVRQYALSLSKLEKCVARFNAERVDFVVHLGDFIDRDFANFDVVKPVFARLEMPRYQVLGNHDYAVADERKQDVSEKLGMPSRYYDFAVRGWRFVVLDGNDISFSASPANSRRYQEAVDYYEKNQLKSPRWNGAVGPQQLAWLRTVLDRSSHAKENVVLFCHFPVYPENVHNLWNAAEVIRVIEGYSCVKAYINGHNHAGNYAAKAGVHYLTLKGMVDTDETSYATIRVRDDRLELTGFGRQEDRIMRLDRGDSVPVGTDARER